MSLILSQATPFLSAYVENGQCQNASIVPVKINEAAIRLWSMGDFVGTIQRWGITVDEEGCFSLPDTLQDLRRVSALADGLPHSEAGEFFMEGAEAFVYDSTSILPIRQVSSGRYQILGQLPVAVDVTAKVKATYATAPTDVLPIDDIYALKMAVLALYYEESNQVEIGDAMWEKARTYLTTKTDTAIAGARRTKFTTILSSAAQNTLGYARAKGALAATDGLAVDDHKWVSLINDAEEAMMSQLALWEANLFKTKNGIFALPALYESVYRVTVNNCPQVLRSNWFEFNQTGLGFREESRSVRRSDSVIKRGPHALHTDMPSPAQLLVSALGISKNIRVNIEGVGEGGSYLRETVLLGDGQQNLTTNTFYEVTSITKDPGQTDVSISAEGIEVAYMWSWQQDSQVMRYYVPTLKDCGESVIRVVARPKFRPKTNDSQRLQVEYPYALVQYALGILAQRAGNAEAAKELKAEAITTVELSMANKVMGEANTVDFQMRGFGFAGLTSRR